MQETAGDEFLMAIQRTGSVVFGVVTTMWQSTIHGLHLSQVIQASIGNTIAIPQIISDLMESLETAEPAQQHI